jgi:hypothetical protein
LLLAFSSRGGKGGRQREELGAARRCVAGCLERFLSPRLEGFITVRLRLRECGELSACWPLFLVNAFFLSSRRVVVGVGGGGGGPERSETLFVCVGLMGRNDY